MLVSRGHDKRALLNDYSIPEVMLFAKAAIENQKEALAQTLMGMRVVSHAKGEVFEKYVKELLGKRYSRPGRRSSREKIGELRRLGQGRRK